MSHHRDLNSENQSCDAEIVIPTDRKSHCNTNIRQNNRSVIDFDISCSPTENRRPCRRRWRKYLHVQLMTEWVDKERSAE